MRKFFGYFFIAPPAMVMFGIMIYHNWVITLFMFSTIIGVVDILGWCFWFYALGQTILEGDEK